MVDNLDEKILLYIDFSTTRNLSLTTVRFHYAPVPSICQSPNDPQSTFAQMQTNNTARNALKRHIPIPNLAHLTR